MNSTNVYRPPSERNHFSIRLVRLNFGAFSFIMVRSKTNKSKKSVKPRRKSTAGYSIRDGLTKVMALPRIVNPVVRIQRATTRRWTYNAAIGLDGFANFDMQLTFAPSATRYYLSGTSIYADSLPNVTEFSSLYDSWRITKVTVRIDFPMSVSNSALLSPSFLIPQLVFAPDFNDAGSAAKADLLQYPQVDVHNFNKNGCTPWMVSIHPRALNEVSAGIVSTAYAAMPIDTWYRTSNFDIQHYGIKLFFDNFGNTSNLNMPFEFTVWYDMEFTNPK